MFALVTGTTNGIGKSVTSLLLSRNLKVIGVDKRLNNAFKNKNYFPNKINILNSFSKLLVFFQTTLRLGHALDDDPNDKV